MKTPDIYKSTGGNPKIRVLVDADVWLELFINRSSFVENAEKLQQLLLDPEYSPWIEVYTTSKCLRRIRYELGESDSNLGEDAVAYVETMGVKVIPIDESLREKARTYSLRDFDSAEEVACATANNLDAIITLNPQNFDGANLPIWSVSSFAKLLKWAKTRNIDQEDYMIVDYTQLEYPPRKRSSSLVHLKFCHMEYPPKMGNWYKG